MFIWILSSLAVLVLSTNEVCPGGAFSCPDTATCCQLSDMSYGCCPMQNAVCCDDHIHCCPQNTKCDAGMCVQLDKTNVTAKKTFFAKDRDIHCFGSEFLCPDNTTCCKGIVPGTYGCCPMEDAVCCSDGYHCCPKNTVCDVEAEKCVGKDVMFEMYDSWKSRDQVQDSAIYKPLLKSLNTALVICPDPSFTCPVEYTCCKLPNGSWGCCPYPEATCCNDHLHCCPEKMRCDNASQVCRQGRISVPSLLKKVAEPLNVRLTCPDNSSCAESMTCCQLKSERYGCCVYDNAVCCQDQEHCCPNGFICDDDQKRCVPKEKWLFNVISKHYKKLG